MFLDHILNQTFVLKNCIIYFILEIQNVSKDENKGSIKGSREIDLSQIRSGSRDGEKEGKEKEEDEKN